MTNQQSEIKENLTDLVQTCPSGVICLMIKDKKMLLDSKNIHLLKEKWYLDKDGYAITRTGKRIHRVIMNAPKELVVDHINHDILDNREENLRIVTRKQNARNRKKQCGVFKRNDSGKWQAQIMIDGKNIKLGCFDTYSQALEKRLYAERKYFN